MTRREILEAALRLDTAERELLVDELTASLAGGFASADIEKAWLDEIERRSVEIDEGSAGLVEWSDARERLAERRARRNG